jgi:RHS repeat-associated protein
MGDTTGRVIRGARTLVIFKTAWRVVRESTAGTDTTYLRTLGIDEALTRTDPTSSRFSLGDALGSTVALTDATGATPTSYTYAPFGDTAVTGASSANPFQFTGRENDGTGLYYYRARYYDPTRSRFISEDPIQLRGGLNFYQYAANSPAIFRDPSGLLVQGIYNKRTGRLTVTDLDTGRSITVQVESGGKPYGDPIPNGSYDILEQQRNPAEYRLDKRDSTPYDDIDDVTGRSHLRLHHPGRTIGCIAAKDWDEWNTLYDLIEHTKTDVVPDYYKPWWKLWPTPAGSLRHFGTLTVQ